MKTMRTGMMNNEQELTAQWIFDTVSRHLLTQGEKSREEATCLYRHPRGLKCAIGCLISDEEYDRVMENHGISTLLFDSDNSFPTLKRFKPFEMLLKALQAVHDCVDAENWESSLQGVAKTYELECNWRTGAAE